MYAPHQGRTEEEKYRFYHKLQHEIDNIRTDEEVLLVNGGLNGDIGMQADAYEHVMGYHCIGSWSDEGERVSNCLNVDCMKIIKTFFTTDQAIKTPVLIWME